MEKRALRTGRRYRQMHYTHSHYLAHSPCRLPSLCPAAWHRGMLRPSVSSRVPVAQESQKGQRWGRTRQHRTNGVLRHSAHTPPHTLSLAFCSTPRRTMPGKCGVQVSQDTPVSAMALYDTCSSLKTGELPKVSKQPPQLHSCRNTE